jgi:opacity protein-like surface antigen
MKIVFLSAALMASGASLAATPIQGWYSSVFGGYTYLPDNISIVRHDLFRSHASYDSGYNAGIRVGYQSNPLRYEAEYTYINANLEKLQINHWQQRDVHGQTIINLGMLNAYYDFPDIVPAVSPFLGIGLGYGQVQGEFNARGPFRRTHYETNDNIFAYQATAGFTYNFAENFSANIAARYVGGERPDELGRVFQVYLATVGVIYRFNEGNYK